MTSIGSIAVRSTPASTAALVAAITGDGVGEPEQPAAHVLLDLGDDAVLRGEVVLIPDAALTGQFQVVVVGAMLAERASRQTDYAAAGERDADSDHAGAALGVQPGEGPGDRSAPVMAHDDGLVRAVGVDDADDVADQFLDAVGGIQEILR